MVSLENFPVRTPCATSPAFLPQNHLYVQTVERFDVSVRYQAFSGSMHVVVELDAPNTCYKNMAWGGRLP